jgi:hypothetical protein
MSKSGASSPPTPSRLLKSIASPGGGESTPRRGPREITRDKITKAWPVLLAPEKKDDLDQIVLDHISGPILYEHFQHIVVSHFLHVHQADIIVTTTNPSQLLLLLLIGSIVPLIPR